MSIKIEIVCDGCGLIQPSGCTIGKTRRPPHLLRAKLRLLNGWETAMRGGRDLCSWCVLERKRAKEAENGQ